MHFKNKRTRVSRAGCFCGGKWDKKVTGYEKRKYADPIEEPLPQRSLRRKKDRRKWCRGKVGVAHKPSWVSDPDRNIDFKTGARAENPVHDYQLYVCQGCGKHLGWRTIHMACGQVHTNWGYGYFFKDRRTGEYVRKPYPCEEKAA